MEENKRLALERKRRSAAANAIATAANDTTEMQQQEQVEAQSRNSPTQRLQVARNDRDDFRLDLQRPQQGLEIARHQHCHDPTYLT